MGRIKQLITESLSGLEDGVGVGVRLTGRSAKRRCTLLRI